MDKARRIVMISGANRGIGAALARGLAQRGWGVSAGLRDVGSLAPDDNLFVHPFDALRDQEQAWVDATYARFGRIDAVIANAGIMIPGSILEVSDADLDLMLSVNVRSPVRLVRAAWPHLVASGAGRVVIVASLSGKRVKSAVSGPYAMTKHAAVALTHSIKKAGWSDGIRATALCPGFVATDMAQALTSTPLENMTQPEDIAALVGTVLDLPNTANVAELAISCAEEDSY
ncbi:SDR family NAD(P)-dependent oxidoreductase [Gluconacetobacter tumulisoli]|uniref:SDR family NAD(P)-dependent oxidoreductase n=1 Tax=Gluconacetobacter tumulisoli TaxID=1286189 RepID=A0A7W4K864_9PROT|nr:SDR family NAD(P)-dependent oxidoreductase [Gluconacetobacter tumulisoli]MBB2202083.1 SDR family NAD(P)-dependent oxidoreductase [Gluconacetobacter tumulisoli]